MKSRRAQLVEQDNSAWYDEMRDAADVDWARLNTTAAVLDDEGKRLAIPAPNAIEWIVGDAWCNSPSTYEYWGQYEAIRDFFELRCPVCNDEGDSSVWGKSRAVLESEVLLVWSGDYQEDVCPKCRNTRSELTEDGYFTGYNTMHLVVGQRAGKSVMAGLIGTYLEHRIVTLGLSTPGGFGASLGLSLKDPFEMTFLAATAVQSADTVWAKFTSLRAESPWFQRFVPWLKRQEATQVVPAGMKRWSYKETDTRIVNQHPSIRLIVNSLNSNAPGLRGRTRPAAFADEISHMEQTDSKKSATEIYRALERSLRTVRTRTKMYGGLPWLGAMVSVTSPVSRGDKGMELLRDARKVRTMFARHLATWEFNPFEPREGMQDEFDKDPVGAARDYGATPPGAEYPLIPDEARWRSLAIDTQLTPTTEFTTYRMVGQTGQHYIAAKVARTTFQRDQTRYYVVWDAGKNFDAFAGACAHGEWREIPGQTEPQYVTVYDWVVRILPTEGTEVFFDAVYEIMRTLKQSMHIVRCEFDRWQSVYLIQKVRELQIFSEQRPTKDSDYVQWRVDSYRGCVQMLPPLEMEYEPNTGTFVWKVEPPEMTAAACAIYELLGAQCDPDTHKVTFPEKGKRQGWGSNDTGQCIVHAHALVQREGYTERHDDRSLRAARARAEANAASWAQRGGIMRSAHGSSVRGVNGQGRGW